MGSFSSIQMSVFEWFSECSEMFLLCIRLLYSMCWCVNLRLAVVNLGGGGAALAFLCEMRQWHCGAWAAVESVIRVLSHSKLICASAQRGVGSVCPLPQG